MLETQQIAPLPIRTHTRPTNMTWPICGRVVDIAGPYGRPSRCHLLHLHSGRCDDLGSAELEGWQTQTAERVPNREPSAGAIALAHARTYEAIAHWRRERGAASEADRLDAMAEALRRLVAVIGPQAFS